MSKIGHRFEAVPFAWQTALVTETGYEQLGTFRRDLAIV